MLSGKKASFKWYTPRHLCPIFKPKTKYYVSFIETHMYISVLNWSGKDTCSVHILLWFGGMRNKQQGEAKKKEKKKTLPKASFLYNVLFLSFKLGWNKWSKIFIILISGWLLYKYMSSFIVLWGIFQFFWNKKYPQ